MLSSHPAALTRSHSDLLRSADIDIVTNQQFYEVIRSSGSLQSVRLASGRITTADLIVSAIGAMPNIELFRDAGISIHKGIVVQEILQTNVADVYAAGDVVEYPDLITNNSSVSGSWAPIPDQKTHPARKTERACPPGPARPLNINDQTSEA
jgi:pyruvate/2-oxoglutarate dehydrogenase complex dihydrolipoamide dehydrogenase (E3) component